jgi:hypothetical protein
MKNIFTGWFTTILGIVIILLSLLKFYGIIDLPTPAGVTAEWQIRIGFLTGLVLFLIPATTLEDFFKKLLAKKTE